MKIYWIILKLVLLTHWCSGFDQISLDRNIFIKKREKKCCIPIFGEIFWEILELLWLMGVLGGSETPSTKKYGFSSHVWEDKKMFWVFFPQWVISILGLSAKKTVSLSELRTKWLDIVVVWIFLSIFHQKCYFLFFFKFS